MSENILTIWSENTAISITIWALLVVTTLYLARKPAHGVIFYLCRAIHNAMRLAARSLTHAEHRLNQRNREVLLESGREMIEHSISREFERIEATVNRELADYPVMNHKLSELVMKIDDDYMQSSQVPPTVPAWEKAVEAVAKIPARKDPMISEILETIHQSMKVSHTRALDEYRKYTSNHLKRLKNMLPHWKDVNSTLNNVDRNVSKLLERSKTIDKHINDYENILRKDDHAVRMLSSSSLTQFFISAFVLAIAVGGAMINFNLIAHPMQEMVGGSSYIAGFKTASIAALVIILVEVAMGLFLMEALRITRLFPVIGSMAEKMRIRMVFVTFIILLILASVESGLAYMREILAQDEAALRATLLSGQAAEIAVNHRWITTAAQMGMGFILPFALTFVAIPLESFVHSMRTVLGFLGSFILNTMAFIFRVIGNIARHTERFLVQVYDLIICGPLILERLIVNNRRKIVEIKQIENVGDEVVNEPVNTSRLPENSRTSRSDDNSSFHPAIGEPV